MNFKFFPFVILISVFSLLSVSSFSQITIGGDYEIDYSNPKEYTIGGITVNGIQYLDDNVLIMLSGLSVGEKVTIPGDKVTQAIEKLWKQGLFEDISISASTVQGDLIFLEIEIQERPRLSRFSFKGVRKSEIDNIRDEIKLTRNDVVTDNLLIRTKTIIKKSRC